MSDTRLLVVQRRLTHYRVPFFEALRSRLGADGVELALAVGDPTAAERAKGDEGQLAWALRRRCRTMFSGRLVWQGIGALARAHDLVVLTQENKLLDNLPLLLAPGRSRVALWGHGRNFQAPAAAEGAAQRWKAALSRRADWWFAYTAISAEVVRGFGYPAGRISVLDNAIDTAELAAAVTAARAGGKAALRQAHGLPVDAPLALFIGSLYAEKRLDLLLDAALQLKQRLPLLQLAIAGAGPEAAALRQRSASLPWVHLLGPRHGAAKAELLAAADVMANPGLVGLGILDAFAAALPLVTTDCKLHSPEIAYLEPGVNGLISAPEAGAFADALAGVLGDPALAARLASGAAQSASRYGLPQMVEHFAAGVQRWRASARIGASATGPR